MENSIRMKNLGLFRLATANPVTRLADCAENARLICRIIDEAEAREVSLVVFPELSICGYTCGDLFFQQTLINAAERAIETIRKHTAGMKITAVVGTPVPLAGRLYNCGVVIRDGFIWGIVPKTHLPNTGEFTEMRWFTSGAECDPEAVVSFAGEEDCPFGTNLIFNIGRATFAVEICRDMWAPIPPSTYHCLAGAQIILNLCAANEILAKQQARISLASSQSSRTHCEYVLACSGCGESTGDTVFAGASIICECGVLVAEAERFRTDAYLMIHDADLDLIDGSRYKNKNYTTITPDGTRAEHFTAMYSHIDLGEGPETDFGKKLYRKVPADPFSPAGSDWCGEAMKIQASGLAARMGHIGTKTAVIGVSGGLDSTLALLVAVQAFDKMGWDRKGIIGVTMPGYATSSRTHSNADDLMEALGITRREIPIAAACDRHFADIGHDKEVHDATFENAQARERTQILMDICNQTGGIVVGTGDLSELALGWCTYNGDHMAMYGVNAGVPKTMIRKIVSWAAEKLFSSDKAGGRSAAEILRDIVDTPISPELVPGKDGGISQVTEDIVGPYELHDFFLFNLLKNNYGADKIFFLACHAFEGIYEPEVIRKWLKTFLRRFFNQQFKRNCMPEGPMVSLVSLSPRVSFRMASDAFPEEWQREAE